MPVRLLTDIDDTLMSAAYRVPPHLRAAIAGLDPAGSPSSFQTPKQKLLWDLVAKAADSIVPVSARAPRDLARVLLPMRHGAIANFGATILQPDGTVDPLWRERMRAEARTRMPDDGGLFDTLAEFVLAKVPEGTALAVSRRDDEGVAVFINFRSAMGATLLARAPVERFLAGHGLQDEYYLHVTDQDVTVLPRFISKCRAAAYLVASRGWQDDLLLGAGDSLSDAPFLAHMDVALLPTGSRVFDALLDVTAAQGQRPVAAAGAAQHPGPA
jgi:trehalose-6-phosphatase